MKDLLVVVPDLDWETTVAAILSRPRALSIRSITHLVRRHAQRDPGVRKRGPELAAELAHAARHAIIILDHEGCGDPRPPAAIEHELRVRLAAHFEAGAEVFVVAPELEAWIARARPQTAQLLSLTPAALDTWLCNAGLLAAGQLKPALDEDGFKRLLGAHGKVASSTVYGEIASKASLRPRPCNTESFPRFVATLQRWFPPRR